MDLIRVNYQKQFFVIFVAEVMERIVFLYIWKVVKNDGRWIRRLFLRRKDEHYQISPMAGMRLLLKEVRLPKRNWIWLMIKRFKSIMKELFKNVIFVRGLSTQRLFQDIKNYVQKRNLWILYQVEFNRKKVLMQIKN